MEVILAASYTTPSILHSFLSFIATSGSLFVSTQGKLLVEKIAMHYVNNYLKEHDKYKDLIQSSIDHSIVHFTYSDDVDSIRTLIDGGLEKQKVIDILNTMEEKAKNIRSKLEL